MPLTPFHWGAMALAFAYPKRLHFPAFLVSSVIVDIEPAWTMLVMGIGAAHGFWHTFLGAAITGIAVGLAFIALQQPVGKAMKAIGLRQDFGARAIITSSVIAALLHALLDSFLYSDLHPFAPFSNANPFLYSVPAAVVPIALIIGILISFALYARLLMANSTPRSTRTERSRD